MSALVLGAGGYIGFAVAQVLRQHGYLVYGLVRKQEHAQKLAEHEIFPVLGESTKPETYEEILKKTNIVIDAVPTNDANIAALNAVKKHQNAHGKKIFIFTSGILTLGNHEEVVFEDIAFQAAPALQPRAKFEAEVVQSKEVHGIVIRPGFVYGYAGGNGGNHLGDKAFTLTDGKIVFNGSPAKRWSWVHIHDLARSYLLAVENFTVASGQIFNIAVENPPTYEEFRRKAAEIAGFKNVEVQTLPVAEGNIWGPLLEQSVRISPRKAQNLLRWYPSHLSILDDLQPVYNAYLAQKKKQ